MTGRAAPAAAGASALATASGSTARILSATVSFCSPWPASPGKPETVSRPHSYDATPDSGSAKWVKVKAKPAREVMMGGALRTQSGASHEGGVRSQSPEARPSGGAGSGSPVPLVVPGAAAADAATMRCVPSWCSWAMLLAKHAGRCPHRPRLKETSSVSSTYCGAARSTSAHSASGISPLSALWPSARCCGCSAASVAGMGPVSALCDRST
mmetsp:Transcript_5067/g.17605  ORF Transcript_5067/g.17605 Transcript_5067/m.17605 type:complete len:212 (-) Transcript_5067:1215-1850(-)